MSSLFSRLGHCLRTTALKLPKRALSAVPRSSIRSFHHSPIRLLTLTDPSRPSLYYHLIEYPTSPSYFALSFLPSPPALPTSRTILGFLPALAMQDPSASPPTAEEEDGDGDGLGLNDFRENAPFLRVLHAVLREGVGRDERWKAEAVSRGEGYMSISDARNPPMPNRTPEPEDTLGMVQVAEGQILPDSYEPMPTYRVCTTDGILTLTPELEQLLIERLGEVDEEERAQAARTA
ncbi:hypothetical protein CALVIDRAFT_196277 [Calocera viscosa TUFC12733]|uniref:Uncharacterized protein n=1 Tax=Calocera viscosa (strain TUFC12733) TaxID=1330018 RepID=A0A167KI03_CALVF|nr:hypothetical protein CALVIDRAFT_196277 [Calocera viscosa TUFC12733]